MPLASLLLGHSFPRGTKKPQDSARRLDLVTEYSSWAIVAALLRRHVVPNLVSYATVLRCHGERGAKAEVMLDAMDRRVLPPCAQGARAVRRRQRFSGELMRRQANGVPPSRAFSHGPLFLDDSRRPSPSSRRNRTSSRTPQCCAAGKRGAKA